MGVGCILLGYAIASWCWYVVEKVAYRHRAVAIAPHGRWIHRERHTVIDCVALRPRRSCSPYHSFLVRGGEVETKGGGEGKVRNGHIFKEGGNAVAVGVHARVLHFVHKVVVEGRLEALANIVE